MKNNLKLFFLSFWSVFLFVWPLGFSEAANKTIYVDQNYVGQNSDGSQEKPFTKIQPAVEKSLPGDILSLKKGIYAENIVLKENTSLVGEERNQTAITGTTSTIITASDNNALENITVFGGRYGVVFQNGGSLKNSSIQKAIAIGVQIKESRDRVDIFNSVFKDNGKGIYVEKNSNFNIVGNIIGNTPEVNKEEGIDIREKTTGNISRNFIAGNMESGIEIIMSDSNVLIEENIIKNNQASGVALHFYPEATAKGKVLIQKNNIINNRKNAIVCKNPSGGEPPATYFKESVTLENNLFQDNGLAIINEYCLMAKPTSPETNPLDAVTIEKMEKTAYEDYTAINPLLLKITFERLLEEKNISYAIIIKNFQELAEENKTINLLLGSDRQKIEKIKEEINKLTGLKNQLSEIAQKFALLGSLEDEILVREEILNVENEIASQNTNLAEKESAFSFLGWIFKLFQY